MKKLKQLTLQTYLYFKFQLAKNLKTYSCVLLENVLLQKVMTPRGGFLLYLVSLIF